MAVLTLVVGDENLLVARAVQRAFAAATAADAATDVGPGRDDLEAGESGPAELAAALSPSLFAQDRLLVIHDLQDADKDFVTALATFTRAPEPGVTIVAIHAGGVKGKASVETLKTAGAQLIQIARVKTNRDREQFALDEIRAAGASIDRVAAAELVAAVGADLREIATACAQLASDVGGQIDSDDVAVYYRGRAESTGFAVADRAVAGDLGAALETLRWAFATGLDPILVSSSLAANLRLIAQVGGAGPGTPDAVAARLGMPAWKVRRAQAWLRRWRPEALGSAIRAVAVADADLKGAGNDAAYAVERAVHLVAEAARAAA